MADGASSVEDSLYEDGDLSHMHTAIGHKKHMDDNSDLGRMSTATQEVKLKTDSRQTAAKREEGLAAE